MARKVLGIVPSLSDFLLVFFLYIYTTLNYHITTTNQTRLNFFINSLIYLSTPRYIFLLHISIDYSTWDGFFLLRDEIIGTYVLLVMDLYTSFIGLLISFAYRIRCPEKKIATSFIYHKGYAEAEIPMYRFAEYNVVNIQCDILVCKGVLLSWQDTLMPYQMLIIQFFSFLFSDLFLCFMKMTGGCGEAFCDDDALPFAQGRAIGRDVPDSEGSLMASYSVYVVDPGAAPCKKNKNKTKWSFISPSFVCAGRHVLDIHVHPASVSFWNGE